MQTAYGRHFLTNHFVITYDQYVLVKIVLPFQSRLELDNKPDHDAIKDLVAGGVKTYFCVQ